jgi:sarcosine oxidase, subunit beta
LGAGVSSRRAEVVVLGAGIAGCATAHHLAEKGVGPVVVFDPETPGAGATGRAAGIVTEQMWDRWDFEVARFAKAEYAALAARHDPTAFRQNGFARWTSNPAAAPLLVEATARLRSWGVPVRPLVPDELAERVPWGRFDGVLGAVWSPEDAVVAPSTIGEIYAERARWSGVDFLLGRPMSSFGSDGGRWHVRSGEEEVSARIAVVAAGAWSKRLLAAAGHPLPLTPYRTQAAVLRPSPAITEDFPSVHDIDLDVYVRPEEVGRILAGDGTEHVEADPTSFVPGGDDSFVEHVAESFAQRWPGWADSELVRAWAGVCVSTPDRRAMVGRVGAADGLYTITGFNGFGVMRAGGAAERLAALIATGDGTPELERLRSVDPRRFGGKVVAFPPRPGFTLEAGDDPRF